MLAFTRQTLIAVGAVGALLVFVAFWLQDVGYRRGIEECQRQARQTRAQLEARWIRDADVIATANQERDDAIAAIDRADAGPAVCLDAHSVQRLRAIR